MSARHLQGSPEHATVKGVIGLPHGNVVGKMGKRVQPWVIVTADDFGLSPEVNRGIIEAHVNGVVTSASLLVNAPGTAEAVRLARDTPSLELGIHLGIVEGYSLRGERSTITGEDQYFAGGLCLHRHWKPFLARYLTGRIDLGEVREELTLQLERFANLFGEIHFANSTQHLHVVPGIARIILELCGQYRVRALRAPGGWPSRNRWLMGALLGGLGNILRRRARDAGLVTTDEFVGFESSGRLGEKELGALLRGARPGTTTEIMTHPGYECHQLRVALPGSYRRFRWQEELAALTSSRIRAEIDACAIRLARFRDIVNHAVV
jgi:predicted glycoside hydrolase/deacetylase ChbG (UPF0249 family)